MNDWAIAGLAVAAWFVLSIPLGLLLGRAIARNNQTTRPTRERPSHARVGPHRPPRKAPPMTIQLESRTVTEAHDETRLPAEPAPTTERDADERAFLDIHGAQPHPPTCLAVVTVITQGDLL